MVPGSWMLTLKELMCPAIETAAASSHLTHHFSMQLTLVTCISYLHFLLHILHTK